MKKAQAIIIMVVLSLLILLLYVVWAHGPDPAGTIVLKGTLGPVDAEKGMITVLDKNGKRYEIKLVKGSEVLICDAYGCHLGRGRGVLKNYKGGFTAGVPVVVDFDPKTGEADRIDIHKDPTHRYLDEIVGDTEE